MASKNTDIKEADKPAPVILPIRTFLKSHDITKLWMARILVRLGAAHRIYAGINSGEGSRNRYSLCIGMVPELAVDVGDEDGKIIMEQLALTLRLMEQKRASYTWSRTVAGNLRLLDATFALTRAEKVIFVLAACFCAFEGMLALAGAARVQLDVTDQLQRITGLSSDCIRRAIAPEGTLRRAGLITVSGGGTPPDNLMIQRGRFRNLVTRRLRSVDYLFAGTLNAGRAPSLAAADFPYLQPGFEFIASVLREALRSKRFGVNILLYGVPGTGKTELTRTLAAALSAPLYEVSTVDDMAQPLHGRERLGAAAAAQHLLKGKGCLLVFDEVETIFNDGSDAFGKPATAEQSKAWVNDLLESTPVPTFWIANTIWNMDAAFVRRFDLVLEMKVAPFRHRVSFLMEKCGGVIDLAQARRLARVETITPALISRAMNVVRRGATSESAAMLETLLDSTLVAQGHQPIKRATQMFPAQRYDPDLCNSSVDLRALAKGLATTGAGRICLYGAPGTGKTAFGYWLAEQLGKPLLLKRVSDIQSPLLGVMERNLLHAFDQASRDGAVLQIDEVDTFLRDRAQAVHGWEVSQISEFLTQLEAYGGVFIASTNLMGNLDGAALRRFDYRVELGYMRSQQATTMLHQLLIDLSLARSPDGDAAADTVAPDHLTPGDFAVVRRRHQINPYSSRDQVVRALAEEAKGRTTQAPRHIGFV